MSMPSSDMRSRVSSSRTASGSAPTTRRRAPVRRRTSGQARSSTWQTLPRLLPAGEDDLVLAAVRVRLRRDQHAVRDDFVVARQPRRGGLARVRRHGDPVVEPVGEEAPRRLADLHPAERAVRVERRDDRHPRDRERRDADRRRHRLVDVEHVEALALRARAGSRARSAARGRCSGSEPFAGTITERPTGITSGGGCPCRPRRGCSTRVKLPGRIVAHDRARLEAAPLQRLRPGARRARRPLPRTTRSTARRSRPSSDLEGVRGQVEDLRVAPPFAAAS